MGWTGGQYSLYRVSLAAVVGGELLAAARSLVVPVADAGPSSTAGEWSAVALFAGSCLLGAPLVFALAAGFQDRLAARLLALLVLLAAIAGRSSGSNPELLTPAREATRLGVALLPALLLLLHAQ
ncbi:hypothetical protein K2X89_02245, partial [Myxococcota bacterium]|nr:hypothetical protein [Myxococcota bacterium]